MTTRTKIDVHAETLSMEIGDEIMHFNIFQAVRHPVEEHSIFFVDIIDIEIDSVYACTNLLSDFYLGSFNYVSDNSTVVCSICVEISSVIHSDCVAGTCSESFISLPPATKLALPSTIQSPSLEPVIP